MANLITNIALWGPTQSGKDWLYKGFVKELEWYNTNSEYYSHEIYRVNPGEGWNNNTQVEFESPDGPPTIRNIDFIFTFIKRTKDAYRNDEWVKSSAYTHRVNLHNAPGGNLLACVINDDNRFEAELTTLTTSPYILVVLEPPRYQENNMQPMAEENENPDDDMGRIGMGNIPLPGIPEEAIIPNLSKQQYFIFLKRLFIALSSRNNPKRSIAICITKSDLMDYHGSSESIFDRMFGRRIATLLESYSETFDIKKFATSAAGFYRVNGSCVPNFARGGLADAESWNPVNCAQPFFWFFQKNEEESHNNSAKKFENIFHHPSPNIPYHVERLI